MFCVRPQIRRECLQVWRVWMEVCYTKRYVTQPELLTDGASPGEHLGLPGSLITQTAREQISRPSRTWR